MKGLIRELVADETCFSAREFFAIVARLKGIKLGTPTVTKYSSPVRDASKSVKIISPEADPPAKPVLKKKLARPGSAAKRIVFSDKETNIARKNGLVYGTVNERRGSSAVRIKKRKTSKKVFIGGGVE